MTVITTAATTMADITVVTIITGTVSITGSTSVIRSRLDFALAIPTSGTIAITIIRTCRATAVGSMAGITCVSGATVGVTIRRARGSAFTITWTITLTPMRVAFTAPISTMFATVRSVTREVTRRL